MRLLLLIAAVFAFVLLQPVSRSNADTPMRAAAMGNSMPSMSASQQRYMAVMDKMNKAMMKAMMDRDPGRSWLKQMAAHHQGAIDMSEIVLHEDNDPQVLRLARKTMQENRRALRELQAKLAN